MLCPLFGTYSHAGNGIQATKTRPGTPTRSTEMIVYIAATIGACIFVVLWATGLNADVSGLIALTILGLGVLAHMATSTGADEEGA